MESSSETVDSKMAADAPTRTKNLPSINSGKQRPRNSLGCFIKKVNHSKSMDNEVLKQNLLQLCKPVSVHLTRLPDFTINKNITLPPVEVTKRKKKRLLRWKYGLQGRYKDRRARWDKRLQAVESVITKQQSRSNDEINDAFGTKSLDPIANCKNSTFESLTMEKPLQRTKLGEKSIVETNETERIRGNDETSGPAVRSITVSEGQEYKLSFTAETNEVSHNLIRINSSATSVVESHDDLSNTRVDVTDEHTRIPLSRDCDNNENDNILLRQQKADANRMIFKHTGKRKVSSPSDSGVFSQRTSLRHKRHKLLSDENESALSTDESNISVSDDNIMPIQREKISPREREKREPRFAQQQRKSDETNTINEVIVVVNRLDNSHSPLVQKWKEKFESAQLDDNSFVSSTARTVDNRISISSNDDQINEKFRTTDSPAEYSDGNLLANKNVDLPTRSNDDDDDDDDDNDDDDDDADAPREILNKETRTNTVTMREANMPAPLDEESKISDDIIIMIEDNEDDTSQEDDDEIIGFMSSRQKVRPSIDSSSSENAYNDQEYRKTLLSRTSVRTRSASGSILEVLGKSPRTKSSLMRQEVRSPATNSSISAISPHRNATTESRTFCHDETTNTRSLRKSRTRDWINFSNSEDRINDSAIMIAPVTRSKSRAALEIPCYEQESNSPEMSNDKNEGESHERAEIRAYESPDGSSIMRDIDEIEDQSVDCGDHDVNRMARNKLTAMKDVMVVLTRLEDLRNSSEDNEYSGNEIGFRAAYRQGFSSDFRHETVMGDTDAEDDIELNSDDEQSDRTGDPLEIGSSLVSWSDTSVAPFSSRKSVSPNDIGTPEDSREKSCEQGTTIITRSEEILHEQVNIRSSQESVESEVDLTLELEDRCSQETIESEVDLTLELEDRCSQETAESDVELSLIFDEGDKATSESLTSNLPEGILTTANVNNDRQTQSPAVLNPENLDEHCKRCNCEESQHDNQRLKCQNISATHKCITCNSLFKNAVLLEEHRAANSFCNSGFRCTVCQTIYMTLIELGKHRVSCAERGLRKQKSVEQLTNEEETSETRASEATITEPARSKNTQKKQNNQKTLSKKFRERTRCRVDDLTCNVCSTNFETKSALSEHIYKHSSVELQEAYRIAMAKKILDSQTAGTGKKKKKKKKSTKKSNQSADSQVTDSDTSVDIVNDTSRADNSDGNLAPTIVATNVSTIATSTIGNESSNSAMATVCPCHRDNDQSAADKSDLQIEMVLLCKYCKVLFRRRECLEIHYRMNSYCAADRTRERWARLFCAHCQLTLNDWAEMRHHLEFHANENAEGRVHFVCNICRVAFFGFGTLCYTHWVSHSKQPMFVAGRYNFPTISVQPMDGTQKLPAGAKPDENYIFVAEHVCVCCKKLFSTRRELEAHQENTSCNRKNKGMEIIDSNDAQWFCDVCRLKFPDRKSLNEHGRTAHDHRYIQVAKSCSSNDTYFMCTHCSAPSSSVRAIEEHWKIHLQGRAEPPVINRTQLSTAAITEPALVTSSVDDDHALRGRSLNASAINANGVTSTDKTRVTNEPTVITIGDDDVTVESENVITTAVEIPKIPALQSTDNRESSISVSSITSTESNAVVDTNDPSVLRDLLKKAPLTMTNRVRKSVDKPRTKTRALEDPFVNVVLSDTNSTNVSASLVINERQNKPEETTATNMNTDSYRILLTSQGSSGNIQMVLGRQSSRNSAEQSIVPLTSQSSCSINDITLTENQSNSNVVLANETGSMVIAQKSVIENTIERCLGQTRENNDKDNKQINASLDPLFKDVTDSPEIIEIFDEESQGQEAASNVSTLAQPSRALNENKTNDVNTGVTQLDKGVASMKLNSTKYTLMKVNRTSQGNSSGSETNSKTDFSNSGVTDYSNSHTLAIKASKLSYEEARWSAMRKSANFDDGDPGGTKTQRFLRVKNISELQDVKKHICLACDTAFESYTSLTEHRQVHMCGVLGKDIQYPKGITAALVLPDPSERPKTPAEMLPTAHTQSIIPAQPAAGQSLSLQQISFGPPPLVGFLAGRGAASSVVQVPGTIVSNESMGSWIHVGNQQISASLTRAETTNLHNGTMRLDPAITGLNYSQNQDNLARQQQSQPIVSTGASIQETNQRLPDNRAGTIGFHALPPMVVLPSSQATKHHTVPAQRSSSSNYLPTSGRISNSSITQQNSRPNKYACNICHTFRCDNIEVLNSHVTKHYTGWKTSNVPVNPLQTPPLMTVTATTVPVPTSVGISDDTMCHGVTNYLTNGPNQSGNSLIFHNWTVKDTPDGPILVTPVPSSVSQQSVSTFVQNNSSSVLRPAPSNTKNSNPTTSNAEQIVYRCMICKCVYKNHPSLRNHVILVHGITDFDTRCLDNIVQKSYHCTVCPSTTSLFDCKEKYRQHVNVVHTRSCPSCRRTFTGYIALQNHMELCRIQSGNERNSFGTNC